MLTPPPEPAGLIRHWPMKLYIYPTPTPKIIASFRYNISKNYLHEWGVKCVKNIVLPRIHAVNSSAGELDPV